jgi:hypothetical protein
MMVFITKLIIFFVIIIMDVRRVKGGSIGP